MTENNIPHASSKLTNESFAELAFTVARPGPGVTLVMTRIDDNHVPVGELSVIDDFPKTLQEQLESLQDLMSERFARLSESKVRIIFAIVEQDESEFSQVIVSVANGYREDLLN